MRQVPPQRDINIGINGPFWVEVMNPEHPFTAMLISRSRGTCLIRILGHFEAKKPQFWRLFSLLISILIDIEFQFQSPFGGRRTSRGYQNGP